MIRQMYKFPNRGLRFVWFLCSFYFHRLFVSIPFSKRNYFVHTCMNRNERIIVNFSIRQYSSQEQEHSSVLTLVTLCLNVMLGRYIRDFKLYQCSEISRFSYQNYYILTYNIKVYQSTQHRYFHLIISRQAMSL